MAFARARAGHKLHWRAEGEGDPVLMVMGLGGSSRAWYRLLPHVREHARAIVFDHRGTGHSDPATGPLTMGDLVGDALAVLDAAGEDTAHVLGTSMGGMVAQHLALDHRARVRSLLLTSTTPVGRGGRPPWRMLAGAALRPLTGPERMSDVLAPVLYARRTREEHPERMQEDLRMRLGELTLAVTPWYQLAAIARHDTRHRLAELAGLPTTVVHGTEDHLVPAARGVALAGAIPGARLVLIERCGHLMTTDAEHESAAAVLAHLAGAGSLSARRGASRAPRAPRAA